MESLGFPSSLVPDATSAARANFIHSAWVRRVRLLTNLGTGGLEKGEGIVECVDM